MDKKKEKKECRTWKFAECGICEYELLTSAAGNSRVQLLPLWSHFYVGTRATLCPLPPPRQWLSTVGGSYWNSIPVGCRLFLVGHTGLRNPIVWTRPFSKLCGSLRLPIHSSFLLSLSIHSCGLKDLPDSLAPSPNKPFVFLILSWCLLLSRP